ncbi:hypothetical protein HMPREF1247_0592 [Atopobium sp. BV3Ac4]|nr:hypothetical protein HMPREF1247_0592 [Atopobium sp. BV3Ac4]
MAADSMSHGGNSQHGSLRQTVGTAAVNKTLFLNELSYIF